jgi:hypothetical protein
MFLVQSSYWLLALFDMLLKIFVVLVREKCPNLGASLPPHLGC